MAFWSTLRRTQLKFHLFPTQFKRSFYQIHSSNVVGNCSPRVGVPVVNKSNLIINDTQFQFANNVRFFAAPVQAKQNKEEKDTAGPRLNEEIAAQSIRLVTDEGHSVVSRHEALRRAKSLKLDLVEVDRNAHPPVCKIVDYNKEKYQQQVKEKERAKSKSKSELKKGACKEIRFAAKINQKDLQMKADTAKRLMESGYRVKCTAIDPSDDLDLETLLSRFSAMIEDVAIVESEPKVEKKQAYVVVRHVKFGPSKKGSGKKVPKTTESTSDIAQNTEAGDDFNKVFDITDNATVLSPADATSRSVVDSARTNTASSMSKEVPTQKRENRYAREPINRTSPMDPGMRNPIKYAPQFSNHGRQPEFNMSPQTQKSLQVETHVNNVRYQDSSHPSVSCSTAKSYGIFSTQKDDPTFSEQNTPTQANRYARRNPSDSSRSPSTTGGSQRNSTMSDSGNSRRPGFERTQLGSRTG